MIKQDVIVKSSPSGFVWIKPRNHVNCLLLLFVFQFLKSIGEQALRLQSLCNLSITTRSQLLLRFFAWAAIQIWILSMPVYFLEIVIGFDTAGVRSSSFRFRNCSDAIRVYGIRNWRLIWEFFLKTGNRRSSIRGNRVCYGSFCGQPGLSKLSVERFIYFCLL